MFKNILICISGMLILFSNAATAQVNLTAETASPGGATHLSPAHMTEIAGTNGIANIQLADGQTLTNSIQNVAEGKTDFASAPIILPFLLSRGVGPYGKLGKEKGAKLAANLRALYPYNAGGFYGYFYSNKGYKSWADFKGKSIWRLRFRNNSKKSKNG